MIIPGSSAEDVKMLMVVLAALAGVLIGGLIALELLGITRDKED